MGKDGKPGAWLRIWCEYFPNAEIFGADIARDILFDDDRIKTFDVDQTNSTSVTEMWQAVGTKILDLSPYPGNAGKPVPTDKNRCKSAAFDQQPALSG